MNSHHEIHENIYSHQGIGDHCKKENHTRRQTQAKRV